MNKIKIGEALFNETESKQLYDSLNKLLLIKEQKHDSEATLLKGVQYAIAGHHYPYTITGEDTGARAK